VLATAAVFVGEQKPRAAAGSVWQDFNHTDRKPIMNEAIASSQQDIHGWQGTAVVNEVDLGESDWNSLQA
jgi:hypothetical protein